jgi:AcrR family transcriptional regulator
MADEQIDRRVQRTRALLRNALMQLINEKGYDAVTIQDITDRANLGRTTFYLHYTSKDDLLLDHHMDFASHLVLQPLSYDELMASSPPAGLEHFLQELAAGKAIFLTIAQGKDAEFIMRGVRQQMVEGLAQSLKIAFPDQTARFPLDMLTHYIIGAQLAMITWWLSNRTGYEAGEVARMLHQLQRAALRDAYGLPQDR